MRPSARLVRAVTAERADLERQREHLAREAADLRAALSRIEEAMGAIDLQCGLLDRVVASSGGAATRAPEPLPEPETESEALKGPKIREVAVRLLVEAGLEGLHYKEWFALLAREGHAVAGKDPLAVFLTQLTRSPVVRKSSTPGHYELDRQAAQRLKRRIDRLQREYLTAARAQRTQITAEIARTEKQLDEATRALPPEELEDAA
jgi:hypothetical protein